MREKRRDAKMAKDMKPLTPAETMARMLGAKSPRPCHLPHPCRVCGAEDKRVKVTVHINGKHTASSCEKCGRTIDKMIRAGIISLRDARDAEKCRAAIAKAAVQIKGKSNGKA